MASSSGAWTRRSISARCRFFAAAIAALLFLDPAARAQDRFRAQVFGGTSWSVPSTLTIEQSGLEKLSHDAHWETRPLDDAPYYAARVSLWRERKGWELQLLHHKIYLTNETPEIESFEVSHGWNLVTAQRAWMRRTFEWRIGAGAVVAHTEGRIRGREVDTGEYQLSGAGALAGFAKTFPIGRRFLASAESFVTYSWARIPIQTGHARTTNLAFHALVGLGFRL